MHNNDNINTVKSSFYAFIELIYIRGLSDWGENQGINFGPKNPGESQGKG